MIKQSRKSTRLVVFDDNGNRFVIIKSTMMTTVFNGKLPTAHVPGMPTYQLSSGEAVRPLSDAEFEVVGSKLKLHKRS